MSARATLFFSISTNAAGSSTILPSTSGSSITAAVRNHLPVTTTVLSPTCTQGTFVIFPLMLTSCSAPAIALLLHRVPNQICPEYILILPELFARGLPGTWRGNKRRAIRLYHSGRLAPG